MKVAIVTQSYPPMISGAAQCAYNLAQLLPTRGHEVLVLAAGDQQIPYRTRQPGLLVERLRSFVNPLRVGQRFALWPHWQIIRYLAEFAPDVIHLHDPFQLGLSCLMYGRRTYTPVVLTIHQLPWFIRSYLPPWPFFREWVETTLWGYARWFLQFCAAAVVGSQAAAREIKANIGLLPEVISNGVNLRVFRHKDANVEWPDNLRQLSDTCAPVILHVGRLDKDKQVDRVVRAAALAMQSVPAYLVIVGDGTEKTRLIQLCLELGIAGRTHFAGYVTVDQGLPAYFRLASVFVTASEVETQGIVLLEAAASGLPIVAAEATCLGEIVVEGMTGLLAPPGDVAGMAERIKRLLCLPELAASMGNAARAAAEEHSLEYTLGRYENLYQRVNQSQRTFRDAYAPTLRE